MHVGLAVSRAPPVPHLVPAEHVAGRRVEDEQVPAERVELRAVARECEERRTPGTGQHARRLCRDSVRGAVDGDAGVLHVVLVGRELHGRLEDVELLAVRADLRDDRLDALRRDALRRRRREVGAEHLLSAVEVDADDALPAVDDDVGDLPVGRGNDEPRARRAVAQRVGALDLTRRDVDEHELVGLDARKQKVFGGRRRRRRRQRDHAEENTEPLRACANHRLGKTSARRRQSRCADSAPLFQSG